MLEKNIINLHKMWIEIEVTNPEGIVQFCSDGFEFFPISDQRIRGKLNFLKWLKENKDGDKIHSIEILNRQVSCLNHLGCLKAEFKTVLRTEENQLQTIFGQHFWHLELESESWKVTKLTWKINETR